MDTLQAQKRNPQLKAKALRKEGWIPCSIYGADLPESILIQISKGDGQKLLKQQAVGAKLTLDVEGEKTAVLVKKIQSAPMSAEIEHIEFQELIKGKPVTSVAKITLLNKDKMANFVNQALFEIPYTALPVDIVDTIPIDLSSLKVGTHIMVGDLPIAKNERIKLLVDHDSLVLSVLDGRRRAAEEETSET